MKFKQTRVILLFALFVSSLFLPAVHSFSQNPTFPGETKAGLAMLLLGLVAPFAGVLDGLANPLALVALVLLLLKKEKVAIVFSGIALVLALHVLLLQGTQVPFAYGTHTSFGTLTVGYYIWLLSLTLLFVESCIRLRSKSNGSVPQL